MSHNGIKQFSSMSCTCIVPEEKGGVVQGLLTPNVYSYQNSNTLPTECPLGENVSLKASPTPDYVAETFFL